MHGVSYAETFDEALQGLLSDGAPRPSPALPQLAGKKAPVNELIPQANDAFENYARLQGEGRFVEAAEELTRLREALPQMAQQKE